MSQESVAQRKAEAGPKLLAAAAPGIFLLLWASGFGVGKVGLAHAEPLTLLGLRYAAVVLLALPVFLALRRPVPSRRLDWLHMAVVGFLIQSVYFGLAYAGMNLGVSAGTAAVIASLQPLIVALASPAITGERIGPLKWLGLLVGAAGAVAVVAGGARFDAAIDGGIFLCLGSALGMAGATLYSKRFPVAAHPVTVNLVQYVVGLATIAPLALVFESGRVDWTAELLLALGWLVLANSILAISLLLFMIGRSAASRVSSLFFLVPPVAAVFGWFLLGETLTPVALAGMAAAALGVALASNAK